ncbi:hypothetical protein [Gillisia hiemivivida]|nr:hypothetical protein [Gillisia hiemivivida]
MAISNTDDHLRNHGFILKKKAGCFPLLTISIRLQKKMVLP